MKKKFKSFISLLLVLIMSLQFSIQSFASELTSSDDFDREISNMLNDEDFQEELQELDELAQYYYDYYQENGEYPSDGTANKYYQENIEAYSDSNSLYMSGSTAVSMLSGAGFSITTANFAELAASLGGLAGIGGPLAAAVVVAIIIGVTYAVYTSDISSSAIKELSANSSEVAGEVGTYVKTNRSEAKRNAREAVITSADYWRNMRKYEYFECDRYNEDGLGGVQIGEPLTEAEALAIVKANSRYSCDIFCTSYGSAYKLALEASSPGEYPRYNFPHDLDNRPYNCPHFHAIIDGEQGHVHVFFED